MSGLTSWKYGKWEPHKSPASPSLNNFIIIIIIIILTIISALTIDTPFISFHVLCNVIKAACHSSLYFFSLEFFVSPEKVSYFLQSLKGESCYTLSGFQDILIKCNLIT